MKSVNLYENYHTNDLYNNHKVEYNGADFVKD